jgi:formylglycine-generating enzyme required for sulfatase activity
MTKILTLASLPLLVLGYGLYAQNPPKSDVGMEFVKISPGEFMMGCSTGDNQCNSDETPKHRVQITKGFEIGKYEVTQAQWVALMQTNPSANKGNNLPVETVTKLEAQDFITKLNAANDGYRYRLPTEAEWEYAARAGKDSPSSGPLDDVAWYAGNSGDETHPVGQKKPNAWGLYDMIGNVREWVSDLYSANYYGASPSADPMGPQRGAFGRGGPGGPGRGGRGGPGGPRGGGRGGPGGPPPDITPVEPLVFPAGATQQQQIEALRQQVEALRQQLQQLQDQSNFGPPGGGFRGRGGPFPQVGPGDPLVDPIDGLPTGLPVVRGGGWDQTEAFLRVSARYSYYGPTLSVSDIGFRVVREPVSQ